ncbi:plasmid stabilization protein [Clostridia bacterium]|nr:plasmid stabilization protein [Clostridia bacterium]
MIDVKWTEPALSDLRAIRDYIAKDSVYYAEKVVDEALDKTDDLGMWPDMGRKVPEENDPTIREIIHCSYRIIYQTFPTHVNILTVIHGKQEYTTPEGIS